MRLKQFSKRTISIILSVLMILSTLMIGTISTANAVGASSCIISAGDYLYYDVSKLTSGRVNCLEESGNKGLAIKDIPSDGIIKIKLTGDYNFTQLKNDNVSIFQWEFASPNWYNVTCNSVPTDGQNMIIISDDGKSYTWGTYDSSSGGETTDPITPTTPSGADIPAGTIIYFNNSVTKWNAPSIYLWNSDGNASTNDAGAFALTKVEGTDDYYSYEFLNDYTGDFLFKNVADSSTWEKQSKNTSSANVKDGYNLATPESENKNAPINWSTYTPPATKVTVTLTQPTGGIVKVDDNSSSSVSVTSGEDVVLTATPDNGYVFSYFTINDNKVGGLASGFTTSFTADTNVSAVFAPESETTYTINHEQQDGVILRYATPFEAGSNVEVTVTVTDGYNCSLVYVNGSALSINNNKVNFTMPATNVTLSTNVAKNIVETSWKYIGYSGKNQIDSNYDHKSMYQSTMGGEPFAYYEVSGRGNNSFFLIANGDGDPYQIFVNNDYTGIYDDGKAYGDYHIYQNLDATVARPDTSEDHYIVVYYPGKTYTWNGKTFTVDSNHPIVAAYSELPGDTYVEKYQVVMDDGKSNQVTEKDRGVSYLDGTRNATSIKKAYDDLTVQLTTEITSESDYLGDFNGLPQKVYGYSIFMEMQDGKTKQVTSLIGQEISSPKLGTYTASYTFPATIKKATVTPIFVSSDEFANAKGLSFTTIYLKMTPGKNALNNTWEPRYYTWRATDESSNSLTIDDIEYANRPEGSYSGQKMLYVGSNMYMAIVESKIKGVLFNDGSSAGKTQTFDYNEFIKLQNLGYNNITFEPKENSAETLAASLNTAYKDDGNKIYESNTSSTAGINPGLANSEFELDVNIEGYYIDVFGNKLVDTSGKPILQEDLRAEMTSELTTSNELTALLTKMGILDKENQEQALYGARYGWYSETGFYGMTYCIRVYYFNHSGKMVSQQISGYGTIEGAQSPKDNNVTNAVYATGHQITLQHSQGELKSNNATNFNSGYELINEDYLNVPYLVSYKIPTSLVADGTEQTGHTRVDGKWYYQATTPQITVNVKTGLMDNNGDIDGIKQYGIITDKGTEFGTVTINGKSTITVDQGSQASTIATPATGYRFVGYYTEDGTFIDDYNPRTVVCANNTTIYAVFQKLAEGTLTITNGVYRGTSPKDGEGTGTVGVELTIFKNDGSVETVKGVNSATATIVNGEGYQWKLTGKATGIDKFKCFRQPEEQADGSYYYTLLDAEYIDPVSNIATPQPVFDASTDTYSYTSDKITDFNWNDYGGVDSLSFNFYTDFQKVSVYATLNYVYKDRFGFEKTYTVKNVLLDKNEIENNYKPSTEKIRMNAPHIDEVFTSCTWICTDTKLEHLSEYGNSVATLKAVQEIKKFKTSIAIGQEEEPVKSTDDYNTQIFLNAPTTLNGKPFKCWMRYGLTSSEDKDESTGTVFSYNPEVGIRVTFDSFFEAVYNDDALGEFTTNLQDPSYTREKYSDEDGNTKDYVYADFVVQFEVNKNETFKNYVSNNNDIKFGLVLERDTTSVYTAGKDENGNDKPKVTPTSTEENVKKTIIELNKNITNTVIKTDGWTECTDSTSAEYNNYYYLYDLTTYADSLTDLGRMDYYVKLANTEINRGMVYNAYTYIIYNDASGNQQIILSTPKMMNIYDIGIVEDGVSE